MRLPAWTSRYGADRIAALPYKVSTAEQMRACLHGAVRKGIGYLYITDAEGPMPWGRLPRYWDAEVAAVLEANRGPDE